MAVPEHVAIIMDGNGRWASERGLPRGAGHRTGAQNARAIVEGAAANGVKVLTLFAFSSENWQRPKAEVRVLLNLFRRTIRRQIQALDDNGVRLNFVGSRARFTRSLCSEMDAAERRTQHNETLDLVVALDYGGRWDIVQAAQRVARACAAGELSPAAVDQACFSRYLSLDRFVQPDLFIRTGGERRISNFLLWDLAYSELYFTDTLWPEFTGERFVEALSWYARRDRRFGGLSQPRRSRVVVPAC